jgi:hypothetical protein
VRWDFRWKPEGDGKHPLKKYNAKVEFSGKIRTGDSDEKIKIQ